MHSDRCVRVYQAYSPTIALPALTAGRFVPPFKMSRMTWIKPSFNWMMYRSNYARAPGQEVVLGIDITHEGFSWALRNAVLSHFTPSIHHSIENWRNLLSSKPVRIQWDPGRDWKLRPVANVKAIQIGLSGEAVQHFVNHWIVGIEDVTPLSRALCAAAEGGSEPSLLPGDYERPYSIGSEVASVICPN
jgi:hypothetical protein